jgi:hypothetical protein
VPHDTPDIKALQGIVSDEVLGAMKAAHETLKGAGIPHALVGALAVGAYGYPRASKDVDFLVGDEAFDHHASGIVTLKPGVPVEFKGIIIDPISIAPGSEHLKQALDRPMESEGIPVAPPEALVYMKLMSPRRKDSADIVELLAGGLATKPIFDYLLKHAPRLSARFQDLLDEAERS